MSNSEKRRPDPQRVRRAPLFPLESDDIAPRARSGPPSPLHDIVGDIDGLLPSKADPKRPTSQARVRAQPKQAAEPEPYYRQSAEVETPRRKPAQQQPQAKRPTAQVTTQPRPSSHRQPALRFTSLEEELDTLEDARYSYEQSEADLHRVELLTARPYTSYSRPAVPPLPSLNSWLTMGVIAVASLLILITLGGGGTAGLSNWMSTQLSSNSDAEANRLLLFSNAHPAGNYNLKGAPSITAQQIDEILSSYGSPAAGTGTDWYNLGMKYGIDPAFAIAFFIHESSAGTNPAWAGIKPGGATTHNVGNIICAGYSTCYGRFRDYDTWATGIDDWYRLIDVEYLQGRGHKTVADIIPVYAPSFENDVDRYVQAVEDLVDSWRVNGVQ